MMHDIARKTLERISRRTSLAAEVYVSRDAHTSVSVLDQKIEELKNAHELGLSIRLIGQQRMGFAYTADLSDDGLHECIEQALTNHAHNAPDPFWSLPQGMTYPESEALQIFDPALAGLTLNDKISLAMQIEKEARAFDPLVKRTEHASYSDSMSEIVIANSHGLLTGYRSTSCGGMADVIAEKNGSMESGSGMHFAVGIKDISPKTIGAEAGRNACQMLGAVTPRTMKTDIVFSPDVGISFLAVLADMFLSGSVQKGRSLLAGKLQKHIASTHVTLIDDGLLPEHIGTAPCDGEGTTCRRTVLVEQGTLLQYLYSQYTANKDACASTGNAHRGSAFGLPDISPSNLYLAPGTTDQSTILKKVGDGVYITKVMGMHTADPVSGDFSIGIAGLLIKNGVLAAPVRGGAIAGNLMDLLGSIETVGSDLRFLPYNGNIGCPTVHIKGVSVSGS